MPAIHEYIWLDDNALRSKVKVPVTGQSPIEAEYAEGWDSPYYDIRISQYQLMYLKPVKIYPHPLNKDPNSKVIYCESFSRDGTPMWFNHRAKLRQILDKSTLGLSLGFEQEYLLEAESLDIEEIINMPIEKKRRYYHGSGIIRHRLIADVHLQWCLEMGLCIQGHNCESIPNQWEFQVGQGSGPLLDPLTVCDDKTMATWLLYRVAENSNLSLSLDCKPLGEDIGGSGCHVNFATTAMRQKGGLNHALNYIIPLIQEAHADHMLVYGKNNQHRLSGQFTTCPINKCLLGNETEFSSAIRIPPKLYREGMGYLEDRRPSAASDPYLVAARLHATLAKQAWPWTELLGDHMGFKLND